MDKQIDNSEFNDSSEIQESLNLPVENETGPIPDPEDLTLSNGINDPEELTEEEPKPPLKEIVKDLLIKRGYEGSIVRLLIAWLSIAFYEIVTVKESFTTFEFFTAIRFPVYIIYIIGIFIILSIINKPKLDKCLLILVTLAYGCYAIAQDDSFYFTIGGCVIIGIVCTYCVGTWIKVRLKKAPTIIIIAVLGLLFTLFTGILTSLNHLRHWSACYDFGIFSQMYEYMKETGLPLTTCERDELLSHFSVHFSPI